MRTDVHRDSDVYRYDLRPPWRRRWRWFALAIVDGLETRCEGWCWTRPSAEHARAEAEHTLDLICQLTGRREPPVD